MRKILTPCLIIFLVLMDVGRSASRIAYTRPGYMMKIPASSVKKAPYLFRTGFGIEMHRFDPFNSAQGIYFDMELGRNFTFGFSSGSSEESLTYWRRGAECFPFCLGNVDANVQMQNGSIYGYVNGDFI